MGEIIPDALVLDTAVRAGFGALLGLAAAWWLFGGRRPGAFRWPGLYLGPLPVLFAAGAAISALPSAPARDAVALWGLAAATGLLGTWADLRGVPARRFAPWLLVLVAIGVAGGMEFRHPSRPAAVAVSILWPLVVYASLRLAGLVYEMPYLLVGISGLTSLCFFPTQTATPPEAMVAITAVTVVVAILLAVALSWQRLHPGDGGWLALSTLLAGGSLLGRSKSLLMFGLLLPSMVLVYPLVFISTIVMTSYFGNDLHRPANRAATGSSFIWSLPRAPLVRGAALVFLIGNFAVLLRLSAGPAHAWWLLALLMVAGVLITARRLARRADRPVQGAATIDILGVTVTNLEPTDVLTWIDRRLRSRTGPAHLVTADSLAVMRANRDPAFARILTRAELIVPDGAGLIWAADFLGQPLRSRVPGVALVDDLAAAAPRHGWRIALLGARPGVAEKAAAVLAERNPGFRPHAIWHGFFREGSDDERRIIDRLRADPPDILLVALGVPRQERWIDRLRPHLPPLIAIGVGGSFDVISGSIPRAPAWMQRCALEWLYRLWREPYRYRRMLAIPLFVLEVFRRKWRH